MVVQHVTCLDITGHTRDELTALRERARIEAGESMNADQEQAARLLMEAFAAFVDARVTAPKDIRMSVTEMVARGIEFAGSNADQGQMAA